MNYKNHRNVRLVENGPTCHGKSPKKTIEKASNIAQKAAEEAKAASEAQNMAGQQAARQVLININFYSNKQIFNILLDHPSFRKILFYSFIFNFNKKYIIVFMLNSRE